MGNVTNALFSYEQSNTFTNLNWQHTNYVFVANSNSSRISFTSTAWGNSAPPNPASGGIYLDSIRVEQIEIVTNLFLYTTFTENTNLTLTPIKFGLPPFTNSPNPTFAPPLNDGFEDLSAYILGAPYGVPATTPSLNTRISGWAVDRDNVDVVDTFNVYGTADTGTRFLDINGTVPGQVSTNVTTIVGADYELAFAFRRNAGAFPPQAEVRVVNALGLVLTNLVVVPTDTNLWVHTSMVFRAESAFTVVRAEGLLPANENGVFLDSFVMRRLDIDPAFQSYFLPEEPLTPVFGERANGAWTLEVWDSRLGPSAGAVSNVLVSWKLEMSFPVVNPPVIQITNPVSQSVITNVAFDEVVYS